MITGIQLSPTFKKEIVKKKKRNKEHHIIMNIEFLEETKA